MNEDNNNPKYATEAAVAVVGTVAVSCAAVACPVVFACVALAVVAGAVAKALKDDLGGE